MTPWFISLAGVLASLLLLGVVVHLIRTRRLRERYALLWLLTGFVLLGSRRGADGLNPIAGWGGCDRLPAGRALRDGDACSSSSYSCTTRR